MRTETTATLVAAAPPDSVFAVVDGNAPITYGEQHARLLATAAGLAAHGVRQGDRVHVSLPNGQEFLDIWFATAHLGAVLVPTNPRSTAAEFAHVLADARPRISIAAADTALDAPTLSPEELALPGADVPAVRVEPADPAAILYTSGTTSLPKGVVVTHANYRAVGRAVAEHLTITAADRWFIALPLFHANAQYYCTMSALVRGASVALAPRFSASGWGAQAARLGATLASLFAAPIRMILANPPTGEESALRTVLFAQNLAEDQAAAFERRFATRLVQIYGMTETVLPTMNPDGADRRWHSIGRPLPGVSLVLAGEDGAPVADGQPGEIRVRGVPGETIAAGYWRDPAATKATFGDGLLRTGDLAYRDADGFLYFVDRAKDMIKRGGENVATGEIERVAGDHPAVAECAAVGIPDPVYDEAILLAVVLEPGAEPGARDILAWCRERLAAHKVPAQVRFLSSLPRTSVGKIRKAELRRTEESP
ncbi:class I adenylate-forming enzyme family protein [Sciscionella sediminilitoris]|uniref:class I adenylate-forming enzyme family protein n=1 Tax=Sciscionella sediminilitoris TaxID=1445613 RepID=UPI00068EE520|nr:AMP-binding protein [Sciscionella sp. SE31]